jgi:cobaltochelatase CobN
MVGRSCRFLLLATLLLAGAANAATIFGIVSERSAPALAAGAERFAQDHPDHRLVFRTPEQVAALSDAELVKLWQQSDAVLLAAVFGDDIVPRLTRLLATHSPRADAPLLAVNSDRRLVSLSRLGGKPVLANLAPETLDALNENPAADVDPAAHRAALARRFPKQASWLEGQAYWEGRGSDNIAALLGWLVGLKVSPPRPQAPLRYYQNGQIVQQAKLDKRPLVAVLDLDSGDEAGNRALLDALCAQIEAQKMQCLGLLARWGAASRAALEALEKYPQLTAIVSLQDFVIGGGSDREGATAALEQLNVPVLKGIRLVDRTEAQWRISEDGMPWETVHYQLAMPELQGASQPTLLAAASEPEIHPLTGLKLQVTKPLQEQVAQLIDRAARWSRLQSTPNFDKRVALVYYNHPPGRHNVGADNLDVPASLWEILQRMKAAGYDTGELPESPEALLELIQERGINLPEDQAALKSMRGKVTRLSSEAYQRYFKTLPESVQAEMVQGPLGYLQAKLKEATELGEVELGAQLLDRTMGDLHHFVEGVKHPARARALDLLDQLKALDQKLLTRESQDWQAAEKLVAALSRTGIEGLRGWGPAPGWTMTYQGEMLLPGLTFGKVFIGPQPPRGWEVNEELLHANTTIPPTHQYLGFYHWLREDFKADAIVHLGRHSTYEFLPRRRAALGFDDYPLLVAGTVPGIYPYIVDGVGEGIQAKRRGLTVMIDHLTPPLKTTPLYDELLELRQLVESWEAAEAGGDSALQDRAMRRIRSMVEALELQDELIGTIAEEHGIEGLTYQNVEPAMLVHEIGHYLTDLQESFMPHGLHVFGRDWSEEAVNLMLESMGEKAARDNLVGSPKAEREALIAALAGRFVSPGKGNDPIRSPEALPTGRNFHALDGGVMPTKLAYELGHELAASAKAESKPEGRSAVVLWASDTVRDEGAMVGFGMALLGVKPVWNSRGIVSGLERIDGERRDVLFTTSGLFRDLYPNLLAWLDRAVLLALDGASLTIEKQHPELRAALKGALEPLAELRSPGRESLKQNIVAAHWVAEAKALLAQNRPPELAGREASLRIFGDVPGAYGAGVNRMVERSGAWEDRSEVADAYLQRMGHAYGVGYNGAAAHKVFKQGLKEVRNTYLGRASNLYGLIDNNDAFDYLGGLNLAVETVSGKTPQGRVIQHANADDAKIERLDVALLQELRGRYLNPAWLKPLMNHDYAGARTMGSEFMEYLWGWQVTSPEIVKSWVWDEVKRVYLDDAHQLGLDEFLEQGRNVHVKTNMEAILLVAAHKGFWQVDDTTLNEVAQAFARHVVEHGLPGSGHTRPDHPMLEWIAPRLDEALRAQFQAVREAAQLPAQAAEADPSRISEIELSESQAQPQPKPEQEQGAVAAALADPRIVWALAGMLVLLLVGGILHGTNSGRRNAR